MIYKHTTDALSEYQKQIIQELEMLVNLRHEMKGGITEPCCISHLLLNRGRFFTPGGKCRHGKIKLCYMNSYHLAERSGFTYCEGYALGIIPVFHAWCVDEHGLVHDPTWKDNLHAYFGVRIKLPYVRKTILRKESYGVLDNWTEHWPILRDDPSEWEDTRDNGGRDQGCTAGSE